MASYISFYTLNIYHCVGLIKLVLNNYIQIPNDIPNGVQHYQRIAFSLKRSQSSTLKSGPKIQLRLEYKTNIILRKTVLVLALL